MEPIELSITEVPVDTPAPVAAPVATLKPAPAPKSVAALKPAPAPVAEPVVLANSEEPKATKRIPLAAGMFRRMYGFMR